MKRISIVLWLLASVSAFACAKGSDEHESPDLHDGDIGDPVEGSDASDDAMDDAPDDASDGEADDSALEDVASDVADGDSGDAAEADAESPSDQPDPGKIVCGTDICDAAQGAKCCVQNNFHACYPPAPPQKCFGHYIWCDEAADCAYYDENWVCFLGNSPYGLTFACNSKGAAWDPQVCKSDEECLNGEPCVAQACGDLVIRSCGPLPADFCNEST